MIFFRRLLDATALTERGMLLLFWRWVFCFIFPVVGVPTDNFPNSEACKPESLVKKFVNYLPMQSIRFTLPMSASETKLVWVRLRLRLVDILVKMWLLKAFFLVILPVPVMLKRFLALELVFIFGMSVFVY
jgi:hypothetical protein